MAPMRVAVIGAGPSGLVVAKEARAAGFEAVVFDQNAQLGGNWAAVQGPEAAPSAMYDSVRCNTIATFMAYSDFPMSGDPLAYLSRSEFQQYLADYARAFGLTECLRLGQKVTEAAARDAGWTVTCGNEALPFDKLVVATGHHRTPRWPEWMDASSPRDPRFIHSHDYKRPEQFADLDRKDVLVVGLGNSACDIAVELASRARSVSVSTRAGGWVFPRHVKGVPIDLCDPTRRFDALLSRWFPAHADRAAREHAFAIIDACGGAPAALRLSDIDPYEAHYAINQDFLPLVNQGRIHVLPALEGVDQAALVFAGGVTRAFDLVVFATGYTYSCDLPGPDFFPFDASSNQPRLYRGMLNPARPLDLAYVGFVQPQTGFMPVVEMQARWLMHCWSGRISLPDGQGMRAEVAATARARRENYAFTPRHSIEVDWPDYTDELASDIGVLPSLMDASLHFAELFLAPMHQAQYRLRGPGAARDLALPQLRSVLQAHRAARRDLRDFLKP